MEINTESTTDGGFEMHKEQFARLAGMSECGMMIAKMQAEPEIMYANDGFYKMCQYTPEEFRECFDNRVLGPALPEEGTDGTSGQHGRQHSSGIPGKT